MPYFIVVENVQCYERHKPKFSSRINSSRRCFLSLSTINKNYLLKIFFRSNGNASFDGFPTQFIFTIYRGEMCIRHSRESENSTDSDSEEEGERILLNNLVSNTSCEESVVEISTWRYLSDFYVTPRLGKSGISRGSCRPATKVLRGRRFHELSVMRERFLDFHK